MKVAITGAQGFLGWHARCALQALGVEVVPIGRDLSECPERVQASVRGIDWVLHLAGVNRPPSPEGFRDNVSLAEGLVRLLDAAGERPAVAYANSIQSGSPTPFGQSKEQAADVLMEWGRRAGAPVADVHLPNLFGEHGRPSYNSVVATFGAELARGGIPQVIDDREVPLLHVQNAVDSMMSFLDQRATGRFSPPGRPIKVSALLRKMTEFSELFQNGDLPDTTDDFDRDLFNTYRSFCFPDRYPIHPVVRSDDRGDLFECVRSGGSASQVFASMTKPGKTRGNHFHRRKIERFAVLNGEAEIRLRRLFHDDVVTFKVSGTRPALVDMPTMWTHSITNVGSGDLTTLFWANEVFSPAKSDTYQELVMTAPAP